MEQISEEDLAYHLRVVAQLQGAQGAFSSWAEHLKQKYTIGPQDTIDGAGVIRRGVVTPMTRPGLPEEVRAEG